MIGEARRRQRRLTPWLRENHDVLAATLGGSRIEWAPVLETVQRLRLVDARGQSPSVDTLSKAWRRVRLQIAEQRARAESLHLEPAVIAAGVRVLASPHSRPDQPLSGNRAPSGRMGVALTVATDAAEAAMIPPPQAEQEGMSGCVRHARDRVRVRNFPLPTA